MTITEFLEARITEDEAVAYDADAWASRGGPAQWIGQPSDGLVVRLFGDALPHIAAMSPARILAECAAKRAIIEQHKDWPVLVDQPNPGDMGPILGTDLQSLSMVVSKRIAWLTGREYVKRFGVEAPTTNMVLALAAVYADHPDYDPEWAL